MELVNPQYMTVYYKTGEELQKAHSTSSLGIDTAGHPLSDKKKKYLTCYDNKQ